MHAYTIQRQDGFDGLERTELPTPKPGPGEISFDVAAAGLGLIDAFWVSGVFPQNIGFIPGIEASGTVRAIGGGITGFEVGDRVAALLMAGGGVAEVATVPAALAAKVPDAVGLDLASVVPINTVTAHLALTIVGRLEEGESVLVHAGMGGLGSQFGTVAKALGAGRVDAVVGTPEKAERALAAGFDRAFLRDELASIPDAGYDIVVDPVGGEAAEQAFRLLRDAGRVIAVGNASQAAPVMRSNMDHWFGNKTTAGFNIGGWIGAHPDDPRASQSLAWALNALAAGDIRVELSRIDGPEELPQMLAELERGATTGKLAVRMSSER